MYPGIWAKDWKSFLAVYPGRTTLSGRTNPGKTSHPGIRAKPGHPGTHWSQLVPAGTSWCQLVPIQLANHCIWRILVSGYPGESWYPGKPTDANSLIGLGARRRFYPGIRALAGNPGDAIYRFRGTLGHPGHSPANKHGRKHSHVSGHRSRIACHSCLACRRRALRSLLILQRSPSFCGDALQRVRLLQRLPP